MSETPTVSNDAVLKEYELGEYLRALGRFVWVFAEAEAQVQFALWHFAGVKGPIGPAVFSGVRMDQGLSLIKRVADAKKWGKRRRQKLADICTHLGELNKLRNDILHLGFDSKTWVVSNRRFVHLEDKIRETAAPPDVLDAATADTVKALVLIRSLWTKWPESERDGYEAFLAKPWLYRSQQLKKPKDKSQKTPPKRQRQRRPSPA